MFSRILVKLIDEAIVPAIFLLASRILSVILVAGYFHLSYSIGPSGFEFADPSDYILINSYSTFSMIVVITVGLFFVLLKSFAFHDTHIHPNLTARLFSLRLSSFIQASFDLYSQGAIWLSYSYLMALVSGVMVLFGLLYSWVFWVALVLSVASTYLFILDLEREIIDDRKEKEEEYEDELVLTLEGIDE